MLQPTLKLELAPSLMLEPTHPPLLQFDHSPVLRNDGCLQVGPVHPEWIGNPHAL
jgi:hypothetical protein